MTRAPGWTSLTVQVTTPLFSEGAAGPAAAPGDGVRPPSIRGVMRFWLRALAGIVAGPDTTLLGRIEREVFGGTDQPSAVRIRIPAQPAVTRPGSQFPLPAGRHAAGRGGYGRWISYLAGPRLAGPRGETLASCVAPGESFDIRFQLPTGDALAESRAALALAALWLACAYGGFGARVRRGFGGLRITSAHGPLPGPWTPDNIQTPPLPHYESLTRLWPAGPVGDCVQYLRPLMGPHAGPLTLAQWAEPPAYPVLSRTHTIAGTSGGDPFLTWADVAEHAGEQLRRFRASRPAPGARRDWGGRTPEWEDVVHGDSTRFSLGALGLPVTYPDRFDVYPAIRNELLRRPSPLWLRPVGEGDQWRLLSFAFCGQFLPGPGQPEVYLRERGLEVRRLSVTDDDIVALATTWIRTLAADEMFGLGDRPPPGHLSAPDPAGRRP